MSQLVRELKRKRDEEARLAQRSPLPVFQETESGQTIKAPEQVVVAAVTALNNLKNAVTLQAGDNVTVTVNGQTITIAGLDNILTGSVEPTSLLEGTLGQFYLEEYTPKLYICTAISEGTYTWTEVGAGGGGGSYTLPQATESELGGVKAKTRTTETAEIAIDTATGKLYGTAPDEAANGLPAGGEAGQVLIKNSVEDYDADWGDAPSGGAGIMDSVVLRPEDLIEILAGNGIKTIVDVNISPDINKALQYNGQAAQTRTDAFDFTCGQGKIRIYYGYETESVSYDWGIFYLNDEQLIKFGGVQSPAEFIEVDIAAGTHSFKMEYRKDGSGDRGYDGFRLYAITYPREQS